MRDSGELIAQGAEQGPSLADLTEEITRRLQMGETVDIEAYVNAHPHCAVSIRELFPTMHDLVELGKSTGHNRSEPSQPDLFPPPARKSSYS